MVRNNVLDMMSLRICSVPVCTVGVLRVRPDVMPGCHALSVICILISIL